MRCALVGVAILSSVMIGCATSQTGIEVASHAKCGAPTCNCQALCEEGEQPIADCAADLCICVCVGEPPDWPESDDERLAKRQAIWDLYKDGK